MADRGYVTRVDVASKFELIIMLTFLLLHSQSCNAKPLSTTRSCYLVQKFSDSCSDLVLIIPSLKAVVFIFIDVTRWIDSETHCGSFGGISRKCEGWPQVHVASAQKRRFDVPSTII